MSIITGIERPKEHSLRVTDNFALFQSWIDNCKSDLRPLCKGISKLLIVDVALTHGQDNPQLIFESMNSTGRELSQADLIRNFILMDLEPHLQARLYIQYWRAMELDFGQEAYGTYFDAFMRHYLTVKTGGDIPNLRDIYDAFKAYARSPEIEMSGQEWLLADIRAYARYFCEIALGAAQDLDLRSAFLDLRELKVDVAYPLLLEVYQDYTKQKLQRQDFLAIVRLIEAYVFRRAICSIPTNSLNKTFATFARCINKDRYLESIQAYFLSLPSYRRFPRDDEFQRDLLTRDLYNFPRRSYWLRRLENHGRKERVVVAEYTIEHILPQNKNLSAEWRTRLGTNWERIQQTWLHTIGNLTLTGYNSEYSDRCFIEKRDMPGGFKESPLKLNQGLGVLDYWNEDTIRQRAERLSAIALEVWGAPQLEDSVLVAYEQKGGTSGYSIHDHPNLLTGHMRALFEAFRREVLALDACVSEEFLKLYVAYKAETNFVDVIPLAKRLRLSLNVPFAEINDARGICRDVTGLGRWGNGDVEVWLSSESELPYVIGLVRQSFEKQMGNGAVD